jgi:hypothetical protein
MHCLFTVYSLPIHCLFIAHPPLTACPFTVCSLSMHCLSQPIHSLFTAYSLPTYSHCPFTAYLPIHCLCCPITAYSLLMHHLVTGPFISLFTTYSHCLLLSLPTYCPSLFALPIFTAYSHCLCTAYSPCLYPAYLLPIHCLFTAYSLPTHCPLPYGSEQSVVMGGGSTGVANSRW